MTESQADVLTAIFLYRAGFMEGYLKGLMDDDSGDMISQIIIEEKEEDDCGD